MEKELEQIGLSEKEARVYLAALELGPETAQNLAQKAEINRATTYVQIDSLKKKGLMSEVEKDGKTLFVAESPEMVEVLLDKFEQDLKFKKIELSRLLPKLTELYAGMGQRPHVRFFENAEGLNAIRQEFIKSKSKKMEGFINLDKLFKTFPEQEKEYTPQRIAKNIESYIIYNRENGPLKEAHDPKKLRYSKHISSDKLQIDSEITVSGDLVALSSYKDTKIIGILIEHKEIAFLVRAIFRYIWNSLK